MVYFQWETCSIWWFSMALTRFARFHVPRASPSFEAPGGVTILMATVNWEGQLASLDIFWQILVNPTSNNQLKNLIPFLSQNVLLPHWHCHEATTTITISQGLTPIRSHPCSCSAQCHLLGNRWCQVPAGFFLSSTKGSWVFHGNLRVPYQKIGPY